MKTLNLEYFAPEEFFKMAESSDGFAYACVEFRFHLSHPGLMLGFVLALLLKTKLKQQRNRRAWLKSFFAICEESCESVWPPNTRIVSRHETICDMCGM